MDPAVGGARRFDPADPLEPFEQQPRLAAVFLRQAQGHRVVVGRAGLQLLGALVDHDAAGGDDDRPCADRLDLFQDVGRDDDRLVAGHVVQQAAHLMLLVRIESVGRFVEDQHLRVEQDRLGQADPAAKALRQGLDRPVEDTLQPEALDRLADASLPVGRRQAVQVGDEAEQGLGRHIAVGRRALGQVAEAPLDLERLAADVEAADRGAAGGRWQIAGDHPHRRRLPGAVGPQKAQHLAAGKREAHPFDRGNRSKSFR